MLNKALISNFKGATKLVADVVAQFSQDQWARGNASLQVPWKLAFHIVDCLDYYFREGPEQPYQWGHRFGGGWWQLRDDQIPDPNSVLDYLKEIEARIERQLSSLEDQDLAEPFDPEKQLGDCSLAHYIYALRHTMHHHGELSLLSLQFGNEEGLWT
jgi:uncharacterized damage-inducible protein DinB